MQACLFNLHMHFLPQKLQSHLSIFFKSSFEYFIELTFFSLIVACPFKFGIDEQKIVLISLFSITINCLFVLDGRNFFVSFLIKLKNLKT